MKKLAAIFVTLLTAVSCIFEKPDPEFELKVGDRIPDFTVQMSDGTVVASSQLREGAALIMFFHTSCPDCQNTLPSVQRIYDEFHEKGVSFALISRSQVQHDTKDVHGETVEGVEAFWKRTGYTMPYSAQPDRKVYNLFATSRVPRVYVCKEGKIMNFYTDDPILTYEELLADVESLLYLSPL
jgi:peroxiredoxin